jgi:hypothetical protein
MSYSEKEIGAAKTILVKVFEEMEIYYVSGFFKLVSVSIHCAFH